MLLEYTIPVYLVENIEVASDAIWYEICSNNNFYFYQLELFTS